MTTLNVPDGPKMLRETLALAQSRMALSGDPRPHMHRLQRLIDECDRHRPLGPDGKHGDDERCTPTCGCDPAAPNTNGLPIEVVERLTRTWPDPFGRWTAEQADAARQMKAALLGALSDDAQTGVSR